MLDEHSQPMTAQPIKFDIDNMKGEDGRSAATLFKDGDTNSQTLTVNTDSRGKATVYVRSKLAKQGVVTINQVRLTSLPMPLQHKSARWISSKTKHSPMGKAQTNCK